MTNINLPLTILPYHSRSNTQHHEKTKINYAVEEVFEGYYSGPNQD
jgi:hypothetical protein